MKTLKEVLEEVLAAMEDHTITIDEDSPLHNDLKEAMERANMGVTLAIAHTDGAGGIRALETNLGWNIADGSVVNAEFLRGVLKDNTSGEQADLVRLQLAAKLEFRRPMVIQVPGMGSAAKVAKINDILKRDGLKGGDIH